MSSKSENIKLLRKSPPDLKCESGEEMDSMVKGTIEKDNRTADIGGIGEDGESDRLKDYERRLEGLKGELKQLKKIKKQQKKLTKLEEEKSDVIREIEKRKDREKRIKGHKKH